MGEIMISLRCQNHESTRYVRYKDIEVILENESLNQAQKHAMENAINVSEFTYQWLIDRKIKPEIAREILPLSLASRLVVTFNLRQWRHFFKQRYLGETGTPHPKIKALAKSLLEQFLVDLPIIFQDLIEDRSDGFLEAFKGESEG